MDDTKFGKYRMLRFYCDCLEPEHVLVIEAVEDDDVISEVSVTMYMNRDLPWKERLRKMWQILTNRQEVLCETVIQPRDYNGFSRFSRMLRKQAEQNMEQVHHIEQDAERVDVPSETRTGIIGSGGGTNE